MKQLFFVIFTLLLFNSVYSQLVSVELSIKWEKGENIISDNSDTISIPYLFITYRNNTVEPLYFLKVTENEMELPPTLSNGALIHKNPNLYERAINHHDYSNENYNVIIGNLPYYLYGWLVTKDTITISNKYDFDIIREDIDDIYEYISGKVIPVEKEVSEVHMDYQVADIKENKILTTLKDHFVFINAGESYSDKYNLIAFKIVGGNFDFSIEPDSLSDFVYTSPTWDKKQEKWYYHKTKLPNKIKEYSLYKGLFLSNSIGIKFKNSLKKE